MVEFVGRITEINGLESSGKSLLGAHPQKLRRKVELSLY